MARGTQKGGGRYRRPGSQYSLSKKGPGATLSDIEKRLLTRFWLKDTQPSIMDAFGLLKQNVPDSTCSYQTARRFLESLMPAMIDRYRNGREAFANNHLPFVDRAVESFKSLDCVVSDHHCLDMVYLYNGKLAHPWITTFQDYRISKVLGWCFVPKPVEPLHHLRLLHDGHQLRDSPLPPLR